MTEERRLDRILRDDYLDGLSDLPVTEIRRRRDECHEEETVISYSRRLVQGKLDIVHAEALRRQEEGLEVGTVLEALPEILGHDHHPTDPLHARHTRYLVPPGEADEADDLAVGDVRRRSVEELTALATELGDREHALSQTRRELFDRIDALQDELAERYRTGTADVRDVIADRQ